MEDRLYKKLEAYGKSDFYPFHMPGHKRNPLTVDSDFPVERDITEINGFDNLHHAEDILKGPRRMLHGSTVCRRVFTALMEAPGRFWQRYLRL